MNNISIYSIVSLLSVFILTSCGKYEEGPKFSLLSKKERVTNTWKMTKIEVNGQDATPNTNTYTLTMTLNDDESLTANYTILSAPFSISGTWAFSSNKESLILTDNTGTSTNTILRLTNKEMKLRQINGDTTVYTYQAQ